MFPTTPPVGINLKLQNPFERKFNAFKAPKTID